MLSAYYLRRQGFSVNLIERGGVGRESSWAGGGILSPLYPWRYSKAVTNLVIWSQAHYLELTNYLFAETGIDSEYINSGFLLLNVADSNKAKDWAQKWNVSLQEVLSQQIEKLEPRLKNIYSEGLWMPDVAQVRNPRLLQAIRAWLVKNQVEIIEHTKVLDLLVKNEQVVALQVQNEKIKVSKVLVAGGAWTTSILNKYHANVNVSPVRGQMIMFKTSPGFISKITILDDHYLIPRKDGRILFGSTLEEEGFDKSTSNGVREKLKQLAIKMVPELENMQIERHWAGLRPGSPQGVPYISQHPQIKNMYVNAGHFRNGVILGPAAARLITQIIANDQNMIVDKEPYTIS